MLSATRWLATPSAAYVNAVSSSEACSTSLGSSSTIASPTPLRLSVHSSRCRHGGMHNPKPTQRSTRSTGVQRRRDNRVRAQAGSSESRGYRAAGRLRRAASGRTHDRAVHAARLLDI
eukprot:5205333-Prymnesium_polylepis.1